MTDAENFSLTDRDLLVRIDTRVAIIAATVTDHEARLRSLERFQWLTIGTAVAISTLITTAINFWGFIHH